MRKGGASSKRDAELPTERDIMIDRKRLGDLIVTATTSPLLHLDVQALSSIKSIVRSSDDNVHAAFDCLLDRLKKNHSQVRYLTVLLMDELFARSKLFRGLLVPVFQTFMMLSVGFRFDCPLPPPEDRAKLLRTKALEVVEKWNDMFGLHYKQLRLGYEYMKKTLRMEFPNAREVAMLATQRRRERDQHTQELLKKKFQMMKVEFPEVKAEVESTLDEIGECLQILTPQEDQNPGKAAAVDREMDSDEEFEEYGVESLRNLRNEVEEQNVIPQESRDNSPVFDTLRDLYRLLATRHLAMSQEWLTTLMRLDPQEDRQSRDSLLREMIDLRNQLLKARDKCEELGIQRIEPSNPGDSEELDEIVWEEGIVSTLDPAEPTGVAANSSSAAVEKNEEKGTLGEEAVNAKKNKKKSKQENGCPDGIKEELLKQAPVLPWGSFLDTWGSRTAVPLNPRGLEFENHWGRVDYDVMMPAEKIAELTIRSSYYKAPKVEILPCSAPLRKGGLCQRRDLQRCPLHGPIIPRDEKGIPISESNDRASLTEAKAKQKGKEETAGMIQSDADALLDSQSADPVLLAEQAILNVRKKDEESRALGRKQRAKRTREHNDACLRDAALMQTRRRFEDALGEALDESTATYPRNKKPRGGLNALLKKKPTSRDRLASRLLNGRVTDATLCQLARDQEAAYRESFPNQWTMK